MKTNVNFAAEKQEISNMESMTLSSGSLLKHGEYRIVRVLGQGGFGITYEAEQVSLGRRVAVKEFFMKDCCNRDGSTSHVSVPSVGSRELVEKFRMKFVREARMIASMKNPHIVRIYDVFEENGTAYYVMEYLPGGSLQQVVRSSGRLKESVALGCIREVADALGYIHSLNTLHLDVKPSNLMLDEEYNVVLIDFGISKHIDDKGHFTSSMPVGISKGYTPLEQIAQEPTNAYTPATDIYALGATLYFLLTGRQPYDASSILKGLPTDELEAAGVSRQTIHAISCAMQADRTDRPQSVAGFLNLLTTSPADETTRLDGGPSTPIKHQSVPYPQMQESKSNPQRTPTTKTKSTSKWLWCVAASIAVVCLVFVLFGRNNLQNEQPSKVETTQSVSASVVSSITGTNNGHEWVDLGLSVKWATMNVGATSPEDYGDYFAWGETSPKSSYELENLKYRTLGDSDDNVKFSKYVAESRYGTIDNKTTLALSDDAARANWGGSWRMPTCAEQDELRKKCTWTWTNQGGHRGYRVTSKSNGNSIFLPEAGFRTGPFFNTAGTCGFYWTSSLSTSNSNNAYSLGFYSGKVVRYCDSRWVGSSVRPVCP